MSTTTITRKVTEYKGLEITEYQNSFIVSAPNSRQALFESNSKDECRGYIDELIDWMK